MNLILFPASDPFEVYGFRVMCIVSFCFLSVLGILEIKPPSGICHKDSAYSFRGDQTQKFELQTYFTIFKGCLLIFIAQMPLS